MIIAIDVNTQYLTPDEFAGKYRVNVNNLRKALRNNRIPGAIKIMKLWRIPDPIISTVQHG